MRSASEDGLKFLYNYARYVPDRLRAILRDGRIWCSNPAGFNDPWDFRIHYATDVLADPAILEAHLAWYARVTAKQKRELTPQEVRRRAEGFRADTASLAEKIGELSEVMSKAIMNQYRVLCLSGHPDGELMWAHYAERHRGVCLRFATNNSVFGNAAGAEYRATYPQLLMSDDEEKTAFLALTVKSNAWRYEEEYRVIAHEKTVFGDLPEGALCTQDSFLDLPPGSLTGIIVGCQAPPETTDEIRTMLGELHHSAILMKAVRASGRYELNIERA